jgi:hypothetical protein
MDSIHNRWRVTPLPRRIRRTRVAAGASDRASADGVAFLSRLPPIHVSLDLFEGRYQTARWRGLSEAHDVGAWRRRWATGRQRPIGVTA